MTIMMPAGKAMSVYMFFWFIPGIGADMDAKFGQELTIESYSVEFIGDSTYPEAAVSGKLPNQGSHAWQSIDLELEMFKGEVFVGEVTNTLSLSLTPGQSDCFRFTASLDGVKPENVSKHELKVSDAMVDE